MEKVIKQRKYVSSKTTFQKRDT